jgi:hypothetical protein
VETALLNQKDRSLPAEADRKVALSFIFDSADWLTARSPDSEGHLLGQLLLDVMTSFGLDHRLLRAREIPNPNDRWNGVIAGLPDFEVKEKKPVPLPLVFDQETRKYATTGLLAEIPMVFARRKEGPPFTGLVPTSLVITRAPPPEDETTDRPHPGKLVFKPAPVLNIEPLHETLREFFETHLDPLPVGYNLNINTDDRIYLARNRDNITAPLTMMLEAAATGRRLRRHTLFFARLLPDGTLAKPAHSWPLLLALDDLELPSQTRLIVGPGLREELEGLLVLNRTSFFTRFEVLEASTYDEARPLFFQDGEWPRTLKIASEGYREVCQKAGQTSSLGNFLSKASVEERLVRASQFSARHLSAKMLATHAVRRPTYFSREMAARDLDRRLEPLSHFRFVPGQTNEGEVTTAYKESRTLLDALEGLLTLSERELLDDARRLIKKINTVGRAAAPEENPEIIWQRDIQEFQERLEDFRKSLREIHAPPPGED